MLLSIVWDVFFLARIIFYAPNLRFQVDDRPNLRKICSFCDIPGYVWTRHVATTKLDVHRSSPFNLTVVELLRRAE